MMVVDSSAIVSILLEEVDSSLMSEVLAQSDRSCVSAFNVYKTQVVMCRRNGASAIDLVIRSLSRKRIEIVPFDETSAKSAVAADERFGKGIDPKARLNLADCAACALAKALDAPLLFRGSDFAATDIRAVL